jgi:hypothetical protein
MKSITNRLKDFGARLTAARSALSELHELDAELRAQHAAALQERSRLTSSPPPLEEVLANMEQVVDRAAAAWAEEHGQSLLRNLGPGLRMKADGALTPERPGFPSYFVTNPFTLTHLVGLAPDIVKQRLRQILSGVEYQPGPATADRERLLVEADAKIAALEHEHEQLVLEAGALEPPVTLELLPSVKVRRQKEARRAELTAREREARERAQQAVEAAVPVRAVRSSYLDGVDRTPV